MKKTLITFLALALTFTASATTISSEKVTVDLQDNTVTAEIHVEKLTTETFNYQTAHPVRDLEIRIAGEKADCEVEKLTLGSIINCETDRKNNFTVRLSYRTSGLVDQQENINVFRYSQSIYRPIQNYTFRVILPEGSGVVDQEGVTTSVISPETGQVGNMNGRRFYVQWTSDPELGQPESFKVLYEPLETSPGSRFFIPGSILALMVVSGIAYFVYRRKNRVNASSVIEELGEDERMVVEMLKGSEGEMLQKDVVDESDYSKSKISGVVSSLVDEGIVTKEKEGRSNKVSLKERYRA